ncbi:MAG: ATP-binding protein [Halioglobus sp.]
MSFGAYNLHIGREFKGDFRLLLLKLSAAICLGAMAFGLDLGRQNPLYGISIHFWDFFVILAALFLGPISGAVAALTLGLLLALGPHNIDFIGAPHVLVLVGEGLFIGSLRYKKRPVRAFDSAVLYWLFIGTPFYALLFLPLIDSSLTAYILDLFRYLGSAICSALLVQLLCLSPGISSRLDLFNHRENSEREWPATIIFNMYLISLIVIPVFIWLQYSVIVADNELEKYLRSEMVDTVSRANSSIQRDIDQSFHFAEFLQGQYVEGGEDLFHSMADIIIPDRPEIAAVQVQDMQGRDLVQFGQLDQWEKKLDGFEFDIYGPEDEGHSIAFLSESLAVLRLRDPDFPVETRVLLDLTRFMVLSHFPVSPNRSISLVYQQREVKRKAHNEKVADHGDGYSIFWESRKENEMSRVTHLGSRLNSTLHYAESLARSESHQVVYSVALKDLVNATIRVQLLTCMLGLIYVLAALVILRLATLKAIGRLRSVSSAANDWVNKKSVSLNLQQRSSVREFNVLTASVENLMKSFVHENEKLSAVELELRANFHKLDSIFDSVNGPLLVFNPEGKLVKANKSARALCGDLPVGLSAIDIVAKMSPEWSPELANNAFNDALKGICTEGEEVFVYGPSGSRSALLISWMPLRAGESIDGVIFAAQDITEKLDSYNQLVHASKLATLGEMATGIAHEINQPLNIIRMAVENVELAHQRGLLDDNMLEEKLARVTSQIDRAAEIVNHIRSFGRKSESEKVPLNVAACADETVNIMQDQLSLDGIKVDLNTVTSHSYTLGDKVQLEQVLINLISNARDAIKEKGVLDGKVALDVFRRDGHVYVQIKDNGGGVPVNAMEDLFDPFFTTKPPGSGTGLGLSVTHNIVSAMGGKIEVSNEASGAVFLITLPAFDEIQSPAGALVQ